MAQFRNIMIGFVSTGAVLALSATAAMSSCSANSANHGSVSTYMSKILTPQLKSEDATKQTTASVGAPAAADEARITTTQGELAKTDPASKPSVE